MFYLGTLAAVKRGRLGVGLSLAAWIVLLRRPMTRLAEHRNTASWGWTRRLVAAVVIQVVGDGSKFVGYTAGQAHRLSGNRRETPKMVARRRGSSEL
jgi:hypothetical protein